MLSPSSSLSLLGQERSDQRAGESRHSDCRYRKFLQRPLCQRQEAQGKWARNISIKLNDAFELLFLYYCICVQVDAVQSGSWTMNHLSEKQGSSQWTSGGLMRTLYWLEGGLYTDL